MAYFRVIPVIYAFIDRSTSPSSDSRLFLRCHAASGDIALVRRAGATGLGSLCAVSLG